MVVVERVDCDERRGGRSVDGGTEASGTKVLGDGAEEVEATMCCSVLA